MQNVDNVSLFYYNIFKYYNMSSNYIRENTVMSYNNVCLNLGTSIVLSHSSCLGLGDDVFVLVLVLVLGVMSR